MRMLCNYYCIIVFGHVECEIINEGMATMMHAVSNSSSNIFVTESDLKYKDNI